MLESCAFLGIGSDTGSRMEYADTVVRQNLEFDPAFPLVFRAAPPTILTPSFGVADGGTAISQRASFTQAPFPAFGCTLGILARTLAHELLSQHRQKQQCNSRCNQECSLFDHGVGAFPA